MAPTPPAPSAAGGKGWRLRGRGYLGPVQILALLLPNG